MPANGSHAGHFAGLSRGLWLGPRLVPLANSFALLLEMGLCCPLSSPEWPPGRTAGSGPREGAPLATRGGLGSAPPSSGICSPSHMLPAPVCRHRAHVSKCASLPSRPPPQIPQQTRQHPQTPPPALALSLAFGAWPPACLCVWSEFLLHWRMEFCVSFCPRSVPTQGPLSWVGCGSSRHVPWGRKRLWPRAFPVSGRSTHSCQLPCLALAHQGRISLLPSSASPLGVRVLLCLPWSLNLSPPAPFCPPVLCHQVLLTLCPRHLLPTLFSTAPCLLHSVLRRFPSSWCARSSPRAAPLDASPCQASWAPSPPSPCTDTAQTRAVSGAAPCGHMAHPGFGTLPGPLSSEALLSRPRPRPRPRRGEELKGAAPP